MKNKIVHHMPYGVVLPVGIALAGVYQFENRTILHRSLFVMLVIAYGTGAVFAFFAHHRGHCAGCPQRTPDQYQRPRLRTWNTFGRFAPLAAAVGFTTAVVLIFGVFPRDAAGGFDLVLFAEMSAAFLFFSLCLSAHLFHRANRCTVYGHGANRAALWSVGVLQQAGHHMTRIGAALLASLVAVSVLTENEGAGASARAVLGVGIFIVWYAHHRHSQSLCEQCAADFPVDAPGYAQKRKIFFTGFHRAAVPVISLGLLCAAGSLVLAETAWSDVLTLANMAVLAVSTLLSRFHARYQPWCPICHPGRGGGGEHDEVPDPTPGHGRPLPV